MAMMFFLSGVFVPASLRRKGPGRFAADRALRLGIPFLFGVLALAPLALYPVFHRLNPAASVADYLAAYTRLPFLPNGPQWFLWLLLALSLATAAMEALRPGALGALAALASDARRRPGPFLAILGRRGGGSPMFRSRFGAAPSNGTCAWPFSFQESRPLLYSVYFFARGGGRRAWISAEDFSRPTARWRGAGRLLAGVSPAMLLLLDGADRRRSSASPPSRRPR